MDNKWLSIRHSNQMAREKLLGDLQDPLMEKAKKACRKAREAFYAESLEATSTALPFVPTRSAQTQSAVSSALALSSPCNDSLRPIFTEKIEKKNKKQKKDKKNRSQEVLGYISNNLSEVVEKNGNLMAEYMKNHCDLILVDDVLYKYNEELGCFMACDYNEIAREMKSSLDYGDQLKISSRDYKECMSQLLISEDLVRQERFFENAPYVNCLNGVVDVVSGELLKHSPKYFFKHCINANYKSDAECKRFLKYVEYITDGNKDLRKLLRVIMGYIMSHYNNAKVAFLMYSIPHTGKSVLCNLIERILGKPYTSHVDLSMMHRQEYAADLANKLLNVAPDLKNEVLKDVGFFKSLVSHDDTISARALYSNPKNIKCECKMLFSSNHLLTFDGSLGIADIEAVFNRLIYFPFQNKPIKSGEENKHLSDDLFKERDAIFTWAMKGLRDYVESGEQFPKAMLSEDIKNKNIAQYCPEKVFFGLCIKEKEEVFESVSSIKAAYEDFCLQRSVKRRGNITTFIEEHEGIPKLKKRIDEDGNPSSLGNPIYVYKGIRLRKQH